MIILYFMWQGDRGLIAYNFTPAYPEIYEK